MKRIPLWSCILLLAIALPIGITSVGCHRHVVVTNTPTGVSSNAVQKWLGATGFFKVAGDYTKQLTDATIKLKADFPDDATYQKTLEALGKADQVGIQGGLYLQSVPNTWSADTQPKVYSYVEQFQQQIDLAINDGLAHVKDSASKQTLQTTIDLLESTVKTAVAAYKPSSVGGNQ